MDNTKDRPYMMVATLRGGYQEPGSEIMTPGLIRGPAVDMIDVVHGSFDFVAFGGSDNVETMTPGILSQPCSLRSEEVVSIHYSFGQKGSRRPRTWSENRRRGCVT